MTLPKIGRFFAAEELQPVVSKASQINNLARLCGDFLPPELARQLRAANLKNGNLVMLAASPAAAAKLKLLSLGLGDFLLKQGQEVNSVSVRVQPREDVTQRPQRAPKTELTASALEGLRELYEKWPDSPARRALAALLAYQETPTTTQSRPPAPEKAPRGTATREKRRI